MVSFYTQTSASFSSKITVFSNRFGDFTLLLFLSLFLLCLSPVTALSSIRVSCVESKPWQSSFLFFLVFFTAITKRAQFPFCSWLPAAIAAPTPVSSLVHSSTLVTAGLFLLIHLKGFLVLSLFSYFSILFAVSLLSASFFALFTRDLKALVAFSTLSQLSLVFLFLTLGLISLAVLHITLHALFKRSLFLAVGTHIAHSRSSQDPRSRFTTFFSSYTPCFSVISFLGLSGLPFFSRFYRKERAVSLFSHSSESVLLYIVLLSSSFLTFSYSLRVTSLLCGTINLVSITTGFSVASVFFITPLIFSVIFSSVFQLVFLSPYL